MKLVNWDLLYSKPIILLLGYTIISQNQNNHRKEKKNVIQREEKWESKLFRAWAPLYDGNVEAYRSIIIGLLATIALKFINNSREQST
jgi:hypothetical protein